MKHKRFTAGVALAGVALLAATACSPRDGGTDGGGGAEGPAQSEEIELVASLPAATTEVDQVTWAIVEGEPETLDPASSANLVIPNLCENLLRLEPDFSITSGVAENADWVDPTTFVIDIREGVTFWDGSPVTPDDVIYSLERNMSPESQWYAAFVFINGMEETGDNQVTVTFDQHDTTFRDALSGGGGAVMQRAFSEPLGAEVGAVSGGLMCTGPFMLDEWIPGSEIVVTANPNYWDGEPLTKQINFNFVTESSTLTSALTNGEIDGAFNVPPGSRSTFEREGAGRLIAGPATASYSFGPTVSEGPAADSKIREAISLAIDREMYIDTVISGLGHTQKTFVSPFAWGNMEAVEVYQRGYDALPEPEVDLDRARELVEESGYDESDTIILAVPAGERAMTQTAQIVQSAAAEIGLTIEIDERQPSDFGALFYVPEARQDVDLVATVGYVEVPGVLSYPQLFLLPEELGGVFNWSGYSDDTVTEKLQIARTASDPVESAETYIEAQEIFANDYLQVTLAAAHHLTYLSNDLTGVITSVASYASPWALHLGAE